MHVTNNALPIQYSHSINKSHHNKLSVLHTATSPYSSICVIMEVFKGGGGNNERLSEPKLSSEIGFDDGGDHHNRGRNNSSNQQQQQQQHPKSRIVKMFNKVQVVYYLTRNGHLEHPHYIEVSHLATQPLRLRDVIERLAILRGKAMPCQYSWSCKRSYKSGYVWNDLTENDAIYASEGSEYVLKGSELMQDRDFSAEISFEEFEKKGWKQSKSNNSNNNAKSESNELMSSKVHQRHSFRRLSTNQVEQHDDQNYEQNVKSNQYEAEEEEKRVSCNSSSNARYSKPNNIDDHQTITMQVEQDESYSLPSSSSTISDKPAQQEKLPLKPNPSYGESMVIEEDGDPHSTTLSRNPVLLQLIACGGAKPKGNSKLGGNKNNSNNNFSMRNNLIPCLKQQLSTRGVSMRSNVVSKRDGDDVEMSRKKERIDDNGDDEDDEDMMMVRYISENPRFGNLQSQEKEYFSGTIVETMTHHHTHSFGSESGSGHAHSQGHPPTFTKSSSYNELRSAKAGLEAVASKAMEEDENDEGVKAKGMIKLCLPRLKNHYPSNLNKSNKL